MTKRIAILDSLRGLAALIVVFHHVFVYNIAALEQALEQVPWLLSALNFVSNLNHLAVLFFFVLSGFAIALATQKLDLTQNQDTNVYLYRRFRRILPLYWIAIGFTCLIGMLNGNYWSNDSYSVVNLIGNLLFLQTSDKIGAYWFSPYGLNGPLWSLSYELFFYLFFPIYIRTIALFFHKFSINRFGIALVMSIPLSLAAIFVRQ